jgi:RNA-splicing ligase RtcB
LGKTPWLNRLTACFPEKDVPIKAWTKSVPLEGAAQKQLSNVASLPFIYKWAAWAQNYALENRELMMANIIRAAWESGLVPPL